MPDVTELPEATRPPRRAKVSIIIPVYNELGRLPQVLRSVLEAPLPEDCEREIIIVDDGSTDGTTELVDTYRGSPLVLVHHSVVNFGKGAAIRVGLAKATGDVVLIQDGDLEYDPRDYPKVIEPIISGRASVVYGSRFMRRVRGMKWANWLANRILTLASNLLFHAGITDEATAYKAFRTDVLRSMRLNCLRFEFCSEVTAKARRLGHSIHEVPISYNPRGIAEGKKIRWVDGFDALWTLIRYRFAPAQSFVGPGTIAGPQHRAIELRWAFWLSLPVLLILYLRSDAGRMLPLQHMWATWFQTVSLITSPLVDIWLLVRYAIQSYFLTLLIILGDLLFGLALLRLLRRASGRRLAPPLGAAVALALGSGSASVGMYGLGLAHRLNDQWVPGLTTVMALVGAASVDWRRARRWTFRLVLAFRVSPANRKLALTVLILTLPVIALHVGDLMMPVLEFDSTMYHMSAAKLYLETGTVAYDDGIRFNAQPQLPILLYLRQWLLLGDDSLAKLANVEFALILLLALVAAGRMLRSRDSWILAVLFVFASPVFFWAAKIEYVDLALAAYFALAAVLIIRQLERRRFDFALPTALTMGFAGACKYQGLVFAGFAVAGLMLAGVVARMPRRQVARAAGILVLGVALVGAPWWVRSYVHTGSPLYPFFAPAGSSEEAEGIFRNNQAFGPGRTLPALLLIGYHVASMLPYEYGDPFGFGLPLLLLEIAGCLVLLRLLLARPGVTPALLFLTAVCLAYLVFWFWTGPVLRYLACLLPVLAVLFLACLKALGASRRLPEFLTLCCALLAVQAGLLASTIRRFGAFPPVTLAQKDAVLANVLPCYPATKVLNQARRPGDWTYLLFTEEARYYLDGVSYGDWWFRYNYGWLGKNCVSIEDMASKLKRAGFRYILVNHARAGSAASIFCPAFQSSAFLSPSTKLPGGQLVFSDGRYSVFQLD